MSLPKSVKGPALKAYFLEHVKQASKSGFYKVVKPLHVFKKTLDHSAGPPLRRDVVTNLIIPVGARVYAPDCAFLKEVSCDLRKMRASKAIVHSQARCHGKRQQVDGSRSAYRVSFIYKNGKTVKPEKSFSMKYDQCDSGIHFFLNLADAYHY